MEEDKNTLDLHTEVREEDRVAKAVALFKEGYNCSQSVVTAFADLYGFTCEQALHMSASFGGGIGRMRETCGAACGMRYGPWILNTFHKDDPLFQGFANISVPGANFRQLEIGRAHV